VGVEGFGVGAGSGDGAGLGSGFGAGGGVVGFGCPGDGGVDGAGS